MTTTRFSIFSSLKLKLFCFWTTIAIILLTSLSTPTLFNIWETIDTATFYFLNNPLKDRPFLQIFWAIANHNFADWIEDLFILCFYLVAIFSTNQADRSKRVSQALFSVIWTAFTILVVNRLICRDWLQLRRQSPTLVLPNVVSLPELLPWITIKIHSTKSFPGDHATTALLFGCSYAHFFRGRLGLLALFYAFLLCLPRLAVGAHWLSDIVVGSGSIVIFSLSTALFTPIAAISTRYIQNKIDKYFIPKLDTF